MELSQSRFVHTFQYDESLVELLKALVHAKLDDAYDQIRKSTFGLVFFGTPHRGGNGAYLGGIASDIARAVLGNPNSKFMEALKKDSLFTDILVQSFRHISSDFLILSFYETRPFKKFGIVSACHIFRFAGLTQDRLWINNQLHLDFQ